MPRRIVPLLLLSGLAVAGCGATNAELAANGSAPKPLTPAQVKAAQKQAEDAPVWIGTVLGYKGSIDDLVVLDYGGWHETRVDLAHVVPPDDCDYNSDADFSAPYTAAIQKFAPVGSTIAVVRSQDRDGTPAVELKGYLYPVNADRTGSSCRVGMNTA